MRILGVVPEAEMKSGEIRSDYLINRLRLQKVAINIGWKAESRKDSGGHRGVCT